MAHKVQLIVEQKGAEKQRISELIATLISKSPLM